jgi:hypothetical protein
MEPTIEKQLAMSGCELLRYTNMQDGVGGEQEENLR